MRTLWNFALGIFAFIVGCLVAVMLGCGVMDRAGSLLAFEREGAPAVEPKPVPSAEHEELLQAAADFAERVLERVFYAGAEQAAPIVGQGERAAEVVSADLGKPVGRWALPPPGDPAATPDAEDGLTKLTDARAEAADEERRWVDNMAEAARQPTRTGWRFASGYLNWKMVVGGVGIGGALLGLLRWGLRLKGSLRDVVLGVQMFRDNPNTDVQASENLKAHLSSAAHRGTRNIVRRIKRSLMA